MNFAVNEKSGTAEGFCLVKTVEQKKTARGIPYLDMVVTDASGEIGAKLWDYKEEQHGVYAPNMLVKIRGSISLFNQEDQLRIDRIRPAEESDGVRLEDYVPCAAYDGVWMFDELEKTARAFQDEDWKRLVLTVLEESREKLLYWPAAFKLHHAVRGGLLYHTLSIVRLAQGVCGIYRFIDAELLLAGAILHDIAKITEFEAGVTGIASGYSVEGTLVGHIAQGAMAVQQTAQRLGIPQEKAVLIEHMILSHHGDPEFGAAVRPMFIEAELLSELDLMDARVYEMAQALEATEVNGFSVRQWALDNRKLYNHGRWRGEPMATLTEEPLKSTSGERE